MAGKGKDASFSDDSISDIFIQKPKPKIMMNLQLQKPLQSMRPVLKNEAIDKIINDPALSQFVSPPVSKDLDEPLSLIDSSTQMTDRGNLCVCSKLKISHASNQTTEELETNNSIAPSVSVCESFKSLNTDSCETAKSFKYTSPLFRTPTLSSQVFKQRLNFRVMKMSSFSINKAYM